MLPFKYKTFVSPKILYRGSTYHLQEYFKILQLLIEKQCHGDVITELDGPIQISHKHSFKNVLPWKHEETNLGQICYKGTTKYFQQKYRILLRLTKE